MIDFRFVCPHCGQRMKCDPRLAGRTVRCPDCRRMVTLVPADTPKGEQQKIVEAPPKEENQT